MLYTPGDTAALQKHIDHYWVVNEATLAGFDRRQKLLAFPGITPDMILVLKGHYHTVYQGTRQMIAQSYLYSFIHSTLEIDLSGLKSFVLVKFKAKGLSSLLPFVRASASELLQQAALPAHKLFGTSVDRLASHLNTLNEWEIPEALDTWFQQLYRPGQEGFIVDLAEEASPTFDLKEIRERTKYSYSTLDRYFKKDTGLSPKQFQSLRRCKRAVQEICLERHGDWLHYVTKYGYFDQPHFIKELQRYTGFTPGQLLQVPAFVGFRPHSEIW